jgi:hypothetical protein
MKPLTENNNYDDFGENYVMRELEPVSAIMFSPETQKELLRYRWISEISEDEFGNLVGVIHQNSTYVGTFDKYVRYGEILLFDRKTSNITVISKDDFESYFEPIQHTKHNVDSNGKYPKYLNGDRIKFRGEYHTVIKQILHFDTHESFWGNLIVEDDSGNHKQIHCWTVDADEQ